MFIKADISVVLGGYKPVFCIIIQLSKKTPKKFLCSVLLRQVSRLSFWRCKMPKNQDTFYKLCVFCHFYSYFTILELTVILCFHEERQILIWYRATDHMTQKSACHDYKCSAPKQTARVPSCVLGWPLPTLQERCYQIFLWVIFVLKCLLSF